MYLNLPIKAIIVEMFNTRVKEMEYNDAVQVISNVVVSFPSSRFTVLKLYGANPIHLSI
jgi:hypothetical protein